MALRGISSSKTPGEAAGAGGAHKQPGPPKPPPRPPVQVPDDGQE
jgi:hypothetical protein